MIKKKKLITGTQPTEGEHKLFSRKPRVLSAKYHAGMQEQETKHTVTSPMTKKKKTTRFSEKGS